MRREWLVNKRNAAGLTQKEVADAAGLARTTFASIEQGERVPSVPTAKKIASVMEFDWTLFFRDQVHETSIWKEKEAIRFGAR
ncbi:Helix-turn-helix [Paenibacillus sp. UNCCL117]|uniref:helix-turn-helix transcriptional regulator n=1 Tax=unclassified Paenibacillus TaxID=185978 RepID=UPI000885CA44|nr:MULTISPECIES: helix-turn-helix transcriptional regulator [unclassified Paenibacillus]SDC68973.1 Helix-turn-helix [Paenibacillus sp. cl123]SFW23776.1 Helix-turn-helix [Paenibacillus sp. UNCCL117]